MPFLKRFIKSEPTLLVHRGVVLEFALRRQRVTRDEVLSVLRSNGVATLEDTSAVILETDGSFSVIESQSGGPRSTLADVHDPDPNGGGALAAQP